METISTTTKTRQSNFELLRIISMLLIMSTHYYNLGVILDFSAPATFNTYFVRFFGFSGRVGMNIFVILSGYFLVEQRFKGKKAVQLAVQCGLLTSGVGLIYYFRGEASLSGIISNLFCVFTNQHWFFTTYFVLYLFSDYLSAAAHTLSRKQLLALVWTLVAVCSLLPTFLGVRMVSSSLFLFVTLYYIGAYIRLYSPKIFESKYCLAVGVGFNLLCNLTSALCFSLRDSLPRMLQISERMSARDDATIILAAVLVFAGFKNMKLRYSKLINAFGATTFGVYLLHMNPYSQHDQWVTILKTPQVFETPYMILHAPLVILGLFVFYALIDMVYRKYIQNPIMGLVDKHWDSGKQRLIRIWNAVLGKIVKKESVTSAK